jgi:hypothetical protein
LEDEELDEALDHGTSVDIKLSCGELKQF